MDVNSAFQNKAFLTPRSWAAENYRQMFRDVIVMGESDMDFMLMIAKILVCDNPQEFMLGDFIDSIECDSSKIPIIVDLLNAHDLDENNICRDDMVFLSSKEWAKPVLEKNPHIIDWWTICHQEWALDIISANLELANWSILITQSWALPLLSRHFAKVDSELLKKQSWFAKLQESNCKSVKAKTEQLTYESCGIAKMNYLRSVEKVRMEHAYWVEASSKEENFQLLKANVSKIHWATLSAQKWALPLMEDNPSKVNWLTAGEWASPIVERNPDSVNWNMLSKCEWALPLIEKNIDKVNWRVLSGCEWAMPILQKNVEMVDWFMIGSQKWALGLMEKNVNRVDWTVVQKYEWAADLLEKNVDKINWVHLSRKPWAVDILSRNVDKICWGAAIYNTALIELIERHEDVIREKLCEIGISFDTEILLNTSVLTYNYAKLKMVKKELIEELMAEVFSPKRVAAWIEDGNDIDSYLN